MVVPVGTPRRRGRRRSALLSDPDRRRRIGAAGRALVETRADYRRCMDQLEIVYRDLLAARDGRRKDN